MMIIFLQNLHTIFSHYSRIQKTKNYNIRETGKKNYNLSIHAYEQETMKMYNITSA